MFVGLRLRNGAVTSSPNGILFFEVKIVSQPTPVPSPDSGVEPSAHPTTRASTTSSSPKTLQPEARPPLTQRWLEGCHTKSLARWTRVVNEAPTIDDLGKAMDQRIPPVVTEYVKGAADNEQTLRDNIEAFQRVRLNPRYATRLDTIDMSTTVLGEPISLPVLAAPVGSLRLLWPRGEAVAAKAVGDVGTICTLSTLTGTRLEEVKQASKGPCWFQLYLVGGREAATKVLRRAKDAGYSTLVLTIDTPVAGNRVGHQRMQPMQALNGTLWQKAKFAPQMMRHLSWVISHYADGGLMEFPNIELKSGEVMQYDEIGAQLKQSAVTWEDLPWIREAWGDGPLVIKGIHNLEDAQLAEQHGVQAIIISNHGGRQLDRVRPTLHVLQEVVSGMQNSSMEILVDGGIRSGSDVVIALAMGAKAVLVGRAYAYGLGAAGEAGVRRAFDILRTEIDDTMRQLGCASLADLDKTQHLRPYPFT